jgi:hypothetical protein
MNRMLIDPETTLVELVAFKWLMAGRGWWIDLSRLQRKRRGVDGPVDQDFELVVMPVIVGVVADAERGGVPLVGLRGIVQPVRGIEMRPAHDSAVRHVLVRVTGKRRRRHSKVLGAQESNDDSEDY